MGSAQVISLSEVRASNQWQRLRDDLHTRFDQWLDRRQEQLPNQQTRLAEVTEAVWQLRQELTGGLSETMIEYAHRGELTRQSARCPQCHRQLPARPAVARTVETMVGPVHVERPYFYCPSGCGGVYPLDQVLDLAPGRKQLDVQQAAAQVAIEMPSEEAHTLFSELTGVPLGRERLHTFVHQAAEELGRQALQRPTLDALPGGRPLRRDGRAEGARRRRARVLPTAARLMPLRLVLVLVLAAGLYVRAQLRASLPQLDGTLRVAGLSAPVAVARDALGIPTIRGASREDVARAMGVPVVGRIADIRHIANEGDTILLDGDAGTIVVRPNRPLTNAFDQRMSLSQKRRAEFAAIRNLPAGTKDGERITLMVNAGLAEDAAVLETAGADGIGLFRTEFLFLERDSLPSEEEQYAAY